ncbi:MAG: hypothetical protein IPK82_19220 [Polyangiaceae bacterium]|nr:hypothetical protein [Polyangiaceae bacterium]
MHPRAVAALVIAISAFLLAMGAASFALAQPAPPSVWVMPAMNTAAAPAATNSTYPTGNVAAYPVSPSAASARSTWTVQPTAQSKEEPAPPVVKKQRDYHFDLGAGTEIPISVGGGLTAELPHRFLLQLGMGVMPKAYSEAIDSFLTSVGAYNAVASAVVRGSLSNAFVLRASAGGRPFADHGFEILAGYTLITAGGAVASADAINAILVESGGSIAAPAGIGDIPVSATLHNFHASLGWRWLFADDRLVIRASISYIHTLAARVGVNIPETATAALPYESLINEQVNSYLGPFFSKYGKAPTLGLSAAVRF